MTNAKDCFYAVADAGTLTYGNGKTQQSWIVTRFDNEPQRDRFVAWYSKPNSSEGRDGYFAASYDDLNVHGFRAHVPPSMLDICDEFRA